MQRYVVGVDGGSTKTIALVADERGYIQSAARGPGSNWSGEDVEIPMAVVAETVRQALEAAALSFNQVDVGVFCLAGADWPEDHINRQRVLGQAGLARRVIVKNDSFGGLRAGTTQPYGMVLAAGSGMNAATIAPDGQEWAFGYYETFGGASTLAQDVFHAVLRAEDGRGRPTILTQMVLEKTGCASVEALLRASVLRKLDRAVYFSLAPLAFEAALAGDEVAAAIIVRQGEGLAEYATAMVRRFHMQDLAFDVVLAGSIFKGVGPLLIDTITQAVHRAAPRARLVRARFEPAAGSVLLAYDALGVPVSDEMYTNLASSMPGPAFFSTIDGGSASMVWKPAAP